MKTLFFSLLVLASEGALADGYFGYISPTQVSYCPLRGNQINVAGTNYTIPPTCVNGSSNGLSPFTVYNAYVFVSGGSLAMEFSTTARETDSTNGNEIKAGDPTRSLVGKVYTDSNGQFQGFLRTISWFNRGPRTTNNHFYNADGTGKVTNFASDSGAYVEIDQQIRTGFLTWGDGVLITVNGAFANDTRGHTTRTAVGLDGNSPIPDVRTAMSESPLNGTGGAFSALSMVFMPLQNPSEGFHFVTLLGNVSTGADIGMPGELSYGVWSARYPDGVYCTLGVVIQG